MHIITCTTLPRQYNKLQCVASWRRSVKILSFDSSALSSATHTFLGMLLDELVIYHCGQVQLPQGFGEMEWKGRAEHQVHSPLFSQFRLIPMSHPLEVLLIHQGRVLHLSAGLHSPKRLLAQEQHHLHIDDFSSFPYLPGHTAALLALHPETKTTKTRQCYN